MKGGRGRSQRPHLKKQPREKVLEKKAFHFYKVIKKELKKSKEFEIRKILRRIKQANSNPNGSAGVEKLEMQLGLAKAADIDRLAAIASQGCHLEMPAAEQAVREDQGAVQATEPTPASDQQQQKQQQQQKVVEERILAAKNLREKLAEVAREMERLRAEEAARNEQAAGDAGHQGAEGGSQQATVQARQAGTKRKQQEASTARAGSQGQGETTVDDGAAAALAKLRGARSRETLAGKRPAGSSTDGSDSECDSGLFQSGSDDKSLLLGSDASSSEGEDEQQSSGNSDDSRRERREASNPASHLQGPNVQAAQQQSGKHKKKPEAKPKNRLGQRARRRMAAMQYGRDARHLQQQDREVPDASAVAHQQHQQKQKQQALSSQPGAAMHPSWAAKQAQKQKLQISLSAGPAAAKKVVFDDEAQLHGLPHGGGSAWQQEQQGGKPGKPGRAPALHPSWEAKKRQQQQQKQMLQPAGKKIVFED